MRTRTTTPEQLRAVELEDLVVTRFVEDSTVVGSPASWRGMPSIRPVRRLAGPERTA
ncbi:MAG: hypothetical protein ABW215_03735 [Kibdelosporangium sp.]